jgi:pimeloyl-ACP methyl ester carboxylesterase
MAQMKNKGNWRSGFESVSDFRMFYRDWRPVGGESHLPVIALHGSLTQGGMWLATAEGIGGARFICPDQRGYGRSEDPGNGDAAADFALDAIRLADALFIDRFTVMGHSFAGAIALQVAAMEPDRVAGAVLVDPTVRTAKGAKANLRVAGERPHRFDDLKEVVRFWKKSEEGRWPAKNLSRFVKDVMDMDDDDAPCKMPFESERLVRLRSFQASGAGDYFPEKIAKKVKSPVLIFRGGESRRFSKEGQMKLQGAFPLKPRVVVCPRSGHFPPVQDVELFEQNLWKFLRGAK